MERRTRIVATLGPATDRPGVLEALLAAGVDVVRLNLSHGTAEEHRGRVRRVRQAAQGLPRPVAVLADLPGPKLRVLLQAPLLLEAGRELSIAAGPAVPADVSVTEPEVVRDVRPGQRLLLDDGRLQLRAVRVAGDQVVARVETGGTLLPNKGINLPDTPLSIPPLTERDRQALTVAGAAGADWLALSFVRDPAAANELRAAARQQGLAVPVLAKLERPEAVERAAPIVAAFDGIMVARGDLGVEIPLERVPHVQKRLIGLARAAAKPVITATDMLDSMRSSPRPTRAEASDVANAICDGSDAVMLSGETAVGDFPVEAVTCMDRIARETEAHLAEDGRPDVAAPPGSVEDRVTHAAFALARDLNADAIVTPTLSGRTARLVARHRPRATVVAPAASEAVYRQLALVWGVVPVPFFTPLRPGEDRLLEAVQAAFAHGALRPGHLAVVLAGHPVEGGGLLPTVRVIRVRGDGRSGSP